MKLRSFIWVALAAVLAVSTAKADIVDYTYADDGDGAIVCRDYTFYDYDSLHMYGDQYWGPGHMVGTITTDTPLDPTITLHNTLDNDTVFAWTAYHVDVWMNNPFTILAGTPTVYAPAGWTGVITAQPVLTAVPGVGNVYLGQVDYYGGPAVPIGGTLDFSYRISFTGATSYAFTQQLVPVPEPSTAGLLALGGLVLGALKLRRRA